MKRTPNRYASLGVTHIQPLNGVGSVMLLSVDYIYG